MFLPRTSWTHCTCKSPGLQRSSIHEKTQPESSAKLFIETCWLNDWNRESMNTWNTWNFHLSIYFQLCGNRTHLKLCLICDQIFGNLRCSHVGPHKLLVIGTHDLKCNNLKICFETSYCRCMMSIVYLFS